MEVVFLCSWQKDSLKGCLHFSQFDFLRSETSTVINSCFDEASTEELSEKTVPVTNNWKKKSNQIKKKKKTSNLDAYKDK